MHACVYSTRPTVHQARSLLSDNGGGAFPQIVELFTGFEKLRVTEKTSIFKRLTLR